MADFAFHFDNVKKATPYTLAFEGSCTNAGIRKLIIKYTGPDVINDSAIAITDDILHQLKEELNKQFGYGPFDIRKVKKNLEAKDAYYFNYK